ncbi:MAG: hypothetical protein BYD32DRAFT_437034 [Podila humilis]|nr:MAG: hypothetical protein BYD32DRAFT_437034 [Podila humilis]
MTCYFLLLIKKYVFFLSGLVKAAYDTPELVPPQAWGINYLAYLRAFHSLSANLSTLLFPISYFNPKPSLRQYMIENELLRKYSDIAIDYHRSPDLGDNVDDPLVDFDLRDLLLEELHTETTWILCGPILDQLQGIVIPVSDIDRYFDEVHRLSSLQSVTFQLDGYSGWFHGDVSELTEEGLHSLIHPTELTDVNWKQFVEKSEATDVTRVTTINMTKPTGRWYGQLKSRPSFLHRCRSLREYNMVSFGPESFKFVSRKDVSHVAHPSSQAPEALLPFLEHVSIHAFNKWFGTELDDIGRSCGTKIRYFKIWGHYGRPTAGSTVPFVEIGSGWNMPRLSKLFLCGTAALSFHPDTLHSTKELQILVLGMPEGTPIPSVQSIHSSGTPWPELVHSDYEDTSGAMFSHPRPQWTWDWHLPNLDTLDLSVGFVLHFQFRMLQRCPNLCELFLSIFSEEGRGHAQMQPVLHAYLEELFEKVADFAKRQEQYEEAQRQLRKSRPDRLEVASLKQLHIYGHWIISEPVLETMLLEVFPNLKKVYKHQCEGFSEEAWLWITGAMLFYRPSNKG